jgi:hypothetical protein
MAVQNLVAADVGPARFPNSTIGLAAERPFRFLQLAPRLATNSVRSTHEAG